MNKQESIKSSTGPKTDSSGQFDKLEVTIIPVDDEPYSKMINIPSSMMGLPNQSSTTPAVAGSSTIVSASTSGAVSTPQYPSLKDIFQAKESLWKPIFGSYVSQNKQPLFSIFRKKITIKSDSKIPHPQGEEIGLHILFLKCDGNRFPRNAFANQLEVYCSTYFYGPLVIVYGELSPPYKLHSFVTSYLMDRIQPLNEEEQKIYPLPFSAKKCATVRNLMADRKFSCDLDQYEKSMSLEEFMIYSYKTSFCPYINKKHEWSECNYAHRQQDFRRPPHFYFYYLEKCPYVTDDGNWDQCPDFLECQYTHSLVEQLFSPLNYKLRPCPDRVPEQKFQCKKRLDLCCHNHSQEEKNLSIKALKNPPKILPEHESMQDYIEIIDSEGLLNNQQNDAVQPEPEKIDTPKQAEVVQQPQVATKKAALAKLPEENQDAWKMLEQAMNQSSIQKKEPTPVPEIVVPPVMQKANSNMMFAPPSVFNDFNSLDDEDSFPMPKKQQFRPFAAQQQPTKNENDYVQQMIQANASNNLGFIAPPQNDGIKAMVKSERKNRKKGKKLIKVQEFNENNVEESEKDMNQHVEEEQPIYRSSSRVSEDLTSEKNQNKTEEILEDQSNLDEQENISNRSINRQIEAEAAECESETSSRNLAHHKKTIQLSKHYEYDLMKVKSILEEDIIEKIDKNIVDSFYGYEAKHESKKSEKKKQQKAQDVNLIKSTAGALLRQKIEKDESILKMTDKYNDQSRFCQLQSSSSSSSEKDLALGQMKKFSTCILDQDVPEEDVEATQEDVVSQEKQQEEEVCGSLFSFNFLNEENNISPNKEFEEQKYQDQLQNNFHNFFMPNDKIFGSPSPSPDMSSQMRGEGKHSSPPIRQQAQGTQTQNIKIENHYNNHTTINNYDFKAQQFINIQQANYNIQKNVNNYTSQNYFVFINAPPPQFNMGSSESSSSDIKSETQQQQQTHQQFFAAQNGKTEPFNVFKIFGQNVPSGPQHENSPLQTMPTETQRTTSSSGTGDSNGNEQEENNSTKEVVIDMCNNVIMGNDKEQSKNKGFRQYPYPQYQQKQQFQFQQKQFQIGTPAQQVNKKPQRSKNRPTNNIEYMAKPANAGQQTKPGPYVNKQKQYQAKQSM